MEKLKALDWVSYVRFASVYREFEDVDHFQREVAALTRKPVPGAQAAAEAAQQLALLPAVEMSQEQAARTAAKRRVSGSARGPSASMVH
jgi:transcriptional repressor NrdR